MINLSAEDISRSLKKYKDSHPNSVMRFPKGLLQGRPKPAAVLIPLLQIEDEWHVLFIRRTVGNMDHSGQVAFPGGRRDPEDTSVKMTALREANEEIGLHPQDVQVLGRLPGFLTISNYRVTPIVGMIPWPYCLKPSPDEVAKVFSIPLSWLSNPANRFDEYRTLPEPYSPIPVTYFKPHQNEVLWGVSAEFTLSLLSALGLNQTDGY
jgi:8-oxo-dGTP pyrophosphatase MutT (NUDIX family)